LVIKNKVLQKNKSKITNWNLLHFSINTGINDIYYWNELVKWRYIKECPGLDSLNIAVGLIKKFFSCLNMIINMIDEIINQDKNCMRWSRSWRSTYLLNLVLYCSERRTKTRKRFTINAKNSNT
jgi:hypothetical protein